MKVIINNNDYTNYLVDGIPITETYTEELDTAIISLAGVDKLTLASFDKVIIQFEDEDKYYVINTYEEQVFSRDPLKYKYNISLISETKKLERIYLPSLKVTAPTPTYREYLDRLLDLYLKKHQFYNTDTLPNERIPERVWIKSNARDVLNDLFLTIPNHPHIVKVVNNKLEFIDLSKRNNEIRLTDGIVESDVTYQTMSDYANNLVIDTKNIVANHGNLLTFALPLRNGENGRLEITDNMYLEIPNARIDRVEGFTIVFNANFETNASVTLGVTYDFGYYGKFTVTNYTAVTGSTNILVYGLAKIDIRNNIVEKHVYDTYYYLGNTTPSPNKKYRVNYLYFNQEDNKIHGLAYREKTGSNAYTYRALENAIKANLPTTFKGSYLMKNFSYGSIDTIVDLGNVQARICSLSDARVYSYKDKPTKHNITYEDNQTENYVNLDAFVKQEKEKINRLGNEIRTINITYLNPQLVPKLGDYIGDYVLCKKEVSYLGGQAIAKLTLSKNYYQNNAYYGLQSRERYTRLLQSNNTVVKNHEMQYIVEFSSSNKLEKHVSLSNYFAKFFEVTTDLAPTGILYSTYDKDGNTIAENLCLQPITNGGWHSAILTAKVKDNFAVGVQLEKSGVTYIQRYVSYVDTNGEYVTHTLKILYGKPTLTLDESNKYPELDQTTVDKFQQVHLAGGEKYYKDNGEIFNLNAQFEFISSHSAVSLNDEIGLYNSLTSFINKNITVRYRLLPNHAWIEDNSAVEVFDNRIIFHVHTFGQLEILVNQHQVLRYTKRITAQASDIYINVVRKD